MPSGSGYAERNNKMEMVINFSGGKDSSAMLVYLCEKYPDIKKHVVLADTGWEHTGIVEWCESIVSKFGLKINVVRNPNKDFFSMIKHRGKFPSPDCRQCTSDLKRGPIQTWIRRNIKDPVIINCMGIRAEESPARSKKLRLQRDKSLSTRTRTVWNYLPIHDWSETKVREYLKSKNIPLHPVYQYLGRLSCQICIYMKDSDLEAVKKNNPEAFNKILSLEKELGFTMRNGRYIDGTPK